MIHMTRPDQAIPTVPIPDCAVTTDALTREAADKIGGVLLAEAGETGDERRQIADELLRALEAYDMERVGRAVQAAQEWAAGQAPASPDDQEPQPETQLAPTSVGARFGVTPAQYGCAARDLNPEPAD